jgi:hypothetical protein
MTAPTGVDLRALERDLAVVLMAHGLADHDTVQVAAYGIEQGGHTAGVTVSAYAYTRPAGLPTEAPQGDPFRELADQLAAEGAT